MIFVMTGKIANTPAASKKPKKAPTVNTRQ
jgi:hypothetical protein